MTTSSYLQGAVRIYPTEGTAGDGNVLILTDDVSRYDVFEVHSYGGNFTVEVSFDGTEWTNAVQLEDRGQTTLTLVTTGVNGPLYAARMKAPYVRLKQSGATDFEGYLLCGNLIGS